VGYLGGQLVGRAIGNAFRDRRAARAAGASLPSSPMGTTPSGQRYALGTSSSSGGGNKSGLNSFIDGTDNLISGAKNAVSSVFNDIFGGGSQNSSNTNTTNPIANPNTSSVSSGPSFFDRLASNMSGAGSSAFTNNYLDNLFFNSTSSQLGQHAYDSALTGSGKALTHGPDVGRNDPANVQSSGGGGDKPGLKPWNEGAEGYTPIVDYTPPTPDLFGDEVTMAMK
jgi:hypothetical protein